MSEVVESPVQIQNELAKNKKMLAEAEQELGARQFPAPELDQQSASSPTGQLPITNINLAVNNNVVTEATAAAETVAENKIKESTKLCNKNIMKLERKTFLVNLLLLLVIVLGGFYLWSTIQEITRRFKDEASINLERIELQRSQLVFYETKYPDLERQLEIYKSNMEALELQRKAGQLTVAEFSREAQKLQQKMTSDVAVLEEALRKLDDTKQALVKEREAHNSTKQALVKEQNAHNSTKQALDAERQQCVTLRSQYERLLDSHKAILSYLSFGIEIDWPSPEIIALTNNEHELLPNTRITFTSLNNNIRAVISPVANISKENRNVLFQPPIVNVELGNDPREVKFNVKNWKKQCLKFRYSDHKFLDQEIAIQVDLLGEHNQIIKTTRKAIMAKK